MLEDAALDVVAEGGRAPAPRADAGRFALVCASHTPLLMRAELVEPGVCDSVGAAFAQLAAFVRDFAPEQIIQFSPDHFHGFHYDVMPSFCVGAAARSYGDWGTATGPLEVDETYALDLLDALREADFDAAVSFDMIVDHGFVQIWESMFGRFDHLPIIPVFVNAIGYPLPTYRRARLLGAAVGRLAASSGRRVLFAASGGLSHDPIVPRIRGAAPALRNRLIGRAHLDPEDQSARERAVHSAGAAAARGEGPCRPLNSDWDRNFLGMLSRCDWGALDALTATEVERDAGAGANEVLAWIAAAAAAEAAGGNYEVTQETYQAIPGWIAGMAMLTARV
jgi:2,3-dihydroxyphenylpropionate 1,2-dioxygenase